MLSILKRNTVFTYAADRFGTPLVTGLAYHGSTPDTKHGIDNLWGKHIDAKSFEEHLQFIDRHFRVIPLTEIIEALTNGTPLPRRSVFITFDDGYLGNYDVAFPLLLKYGMTATFFVMTAFAGTQNLFSFDIIDSAVKHTSRAEIEVPMLEKTEWVQIEGDRTKAALCLHEFFKTIMLEDQTSWLEEFVKQSGFNSVADVPVLGDHVRFMNWKQLAEMKNAGMEIGSHTHRHAIIGRTLPAIAKDELLRSKRIIEEKLGTQCRVFCYPNGGYPRDGNEQTNRIVKEAGYKGAIYMSRGMNTRTTSPFFITRYAAGQYTRLTGLRELLSGVAIRAKRILGKDTSPQEFCNRTSEIKSSQ